MFNFCTHTSLSLLLITSLIFTFKGKLTPSTFLLLSLTAIILFFIFRKIRFNILAGCKSEFESKQEQINLLKESIDAKVRALMTLPQMCQKVSSLFNVSKELIELIDIEEIFDLLVSTLEDLFPEADSVLILDFDKGKDSLALVRSFKRKNFVIKEKKGDLIDKWILRHNISLLVEDIVKDFRFDSDIISAYKDREIRSFLLGPISIDCKLLGIARVESKKASAFSLDDLRLLRNICDLAAVVIEKARLFDDTQDLAIKDSLTSFFVKDYFFERLADESQRALSQNSKLGIIMLDIDNFKDINNTHGHIVGDFVLKKLARILTKAAKGAGNIISRFGGEEFIILIAQCDKEKLISLSEEIRKAAEVSSLSFRRKKITFTVSLGAVLYPDAGKDILELVGEADKLMYKAKKQGKNRACFSN